MLSVYPFDIVTVLHYEIAEDVVFLFFWQVYMGEAYYKMQLFPETK